jgi:hypothetical protein
MDLYLLMPDSRSVIVSEEIAERFDAYGRRPGQLGFKDEPRSAQEHRTHLAFQGEFARLFGPKRRGRGGGFAGEFWSYLTGRVNP